MRIVNNKIYIVKGETPTYSASVIDKDTGAPLVIDRKIVDGSLVQTMVIEFVVRESAFSRDEDFKLKYYLILGKDISYHLFDGEEIKSYNALGGDIEEWQNDVVPPVGEENYLYRRTDSRGDNFYAYYANGAWVDYEFSFDVTFAYKYTSIMEPKTYKYEIALLGGKLKLNPADDETPVNVVYKKPLLGLTDFIVEGSISE